MPHVKRGDHEKGHPVHVTLRTHSKSLRTQFVFPTIRGAIQDISRRRGGSFRVVHFSVQYHHLHLIIEAEDRDSLLSGVKGLAVSLARRINRLLFRRGRLIADRWHSRPLTTARDVRRTLVYVLGNASKHRELAKPGVDPYSSGPYFNGFREFPGGTPVERDPKVIPRCLAPPGDSPVVPPGTWLLRQGWRALGLISVREVPRSEPVR